MDGVTGVILMLISVGATVRLAGLEVMPAREAEIVVLPTVTPVATPVVLTIVAMAMFAECQVT